jgi:hypothetical protein
MGSDCSCALDRMIKMRKGAKDVSESF